MHLGNRGRWSIDTWAAPRCTRSTNRDHELSRIRRPIEPRRCLNVCRIGWLRGTPHQLTPSRGGTAISARGVGFGQDEEALDSSK